MQEYIRAAWETSWVEEIKCLRTYVGIGPEMWEDTFLIKDLYLQITSISSSVYNVDHCPFEISSPERTRGFPTSIQYNLFIYFLFFQQIRCSKSKQQSSRNFLSTYTYGLFSIDIINNTRLSLLFQVSPNL